jgi:Tfp pilus assembly protein PilZ
MTDERDQQKEEAPPPKQLGGIERRKHIRLSHMGTASITVRGREPREVYMGCIGRGGAGYYTHENVRAGELVVLDLRLKEEKWEDREMKFAARVCWVKPVGELFMVGLKFEKMSDERYRLLLRHLHLMKDLQL